ncbi:MAG: hypothetical protein ABIR60_08540 [Allosphingosinicella sp.]
MGPGGNGGRNGRSVVGGANIPIVGGARTWMLCGRGHVEELAGPFTMQIPGPPGEPAIAIQLCRACWINFVSMFGARPMSAEELEQFQAAQASATGEA